MIVFDNIVEIILYTQDRCGYCTLLKNKLTEWGYSYTEKNIMYDAEAKKFIKEEPLMGQMVYPNEYLLSQGIKKDDYVCFTPDSEYEFTVDGEKLYRMYDHQITMKL